MISWNTARCTARRHALHPSIEQLRQRAAMRALEARYGRAARRRRAARRGGSRVRARGSACESGRHRGDARRRRDRSGRRAPGSRRRLRAVAAPRRSTPPASSSTRISAARRSRAPAAERVGRARGRLHEPRVRPRRRARAGSATCTPSGCSAGSPAPKPRSSSTTTPPRRCSSSPRSAAGREVIVSRGELVEIGGGFRVPDVMAQSGAILREVGTTNRTRAADYAAAIGDRTALILRVHPSNFRIEGFTERPALAELVGARPPLRACRSSRTSAAAASARRLRAVAGPRRRAGRCRRASRAGADVVMFSGDKLLGGPQAGIIAGRRALVDRVRAHPLMRALRVGQADLRGARGDARRVRRAAAPATTVPVARMIAMPLDEIDARARRAGRGARRARPARPTSSTAIRRSAAAARPGSALPTRLVAIDRTRHSARTALEAQLRRQPTAGHRAHRGRSRRPRPPHGRSGGRRSTRRRVADLSSGCSAGLQASPARAFSRPAGAVRPPRTGAVRPARKGAAPASPQPADRPAATGPT